MKKEKLNKIIVGTLIPSILLPSCTSDGYFYDDDVFTINKALLTRSGNSIAVPMNLELNSEDQKYLDFIMKIVSDIIDNPLIAKQFAENPNFIAKAYGMNDIQISFDDEIWKLISSLGDEDLHDAIKTNDVSRFLYLCSEKGLLSELQKSDIMKYQNLFITESQIQPMCASLVFFAAVAVMMMAAAGCAAAGAAAVYIVETYWDGSLKRSQLWLSEILKHIKSG